MYLIASSLVSEREMLNKLLLVISTIPSLVQVWVVGGPPLVPPIRVMVGGSVRNEEEEIYTWFEVRVPPRAGSKTGKSGVHGSL
jgi:hypothetical protein